ncbi:hypothetical protein KAT63_04380 [Candidatus Parcubacteria bacterium]|nr:hypothetical protein [Candidatus Parcubacteria bacterium]
MKMNLWEQEKSALRIARRFSKILECGTGVIGGTVSERNELLNTIRPSDKCLVSAEGLCNKHHHRHLPDVGIIECEIAYKSDLEFLKKILSEVSYVSGLSVANIVTRLLMHGMPLKDLNSASFAEVKNTPLLPIVVWPERNTPQEMYSMPIEDFRVMREDRPDWCLWRSPVAEKYGCYVRSKDGFYKKLSVDEMKKRASEFISPYAHGGEWDVDFAILAIVNNPYAKGKKIVMAGGNHWLGTFAANAMMCLVKKVPERKTIFEKTISSMAWLGEVVERENLDNFQAIIRVTDNFQPDGSRKIDAEVTAVFPL